MYQKCEIETALWQTPRLVGDLAPQPKIQRIELCFQPRSQGVLTSHTDRKAE